MLTTKSLARHSRTKRFNRDGQDKKSQLHHEGNEVKPGTSVCLTGIPG